MASWETIPVLEEALAALSTLLIWAFVFKITDKYILGLNTVSVCDASVDLGCYVLQLS
jgi:hypothetical protein